MAINWILLAPVIITALGGVVAVLFEAFISNRSRWRVQTVYGPLVLLVALAAAIMNLPVIGDGQLVIGTELVLDSMGAIAQIVVLVIAFLAILVVADRSELGDGAFAGQASDAPGSYDEEVTSKMGYQRSEVFPLVLFSTTGMLVFPVANSMVSLFVALEVLSLPLYVMAATARHRRLLSQESALKYFVLGAFSSAFFLMGMAMLYGYSGSIQFSDVARGILPGNGSDLLLIMGVALVTTGLLFKVGAAPFHAWTPDVYQGAPTPITGFMAAGVKAAAFLALLRFYFTISVQIQWDVVTFMWIVAILTMVVGTFFGLVQADMKRLLAYSSIAHAGFILIAIISVQPSAVGATLFYLITYGIATIGAFAVISLVRGVDSSGNAIGENAKIDDWAGIGRTNPWIGAAMVLFLLSFAGIPLTAGFIGKFLVFSSGITGDATALVIIAVVASAITAFYYFRVMMVMFFKEPTGKVTVVKSEGFSFMVIMICAVATILLGVLPGFVMNLLSDVLILVP